MYIPVAGSLLALAVLPSPAIAQQQGDSRFSDAHFQAPPIIETVEPSFVHPPPPRPQDQAPVQPPAPVRVAAADESGFEFSWRGFAHTVGAALVGGWVGYVGSQVVKDDWEKETNGTFRNHRSLLAAAGALAGVVGMRLIGDTDSPLEGLTPERRQPSHDILTEEQIRSSATANAYELVSTLRQQWLVVRGLHSHTESAQGHGEGFELTIQPGANKIIVYMDDIRLGGVAAMKDIPSDMLTSARFLDAREATYRFGSGHTHGAILLSSRAPVAR